ncbi:hypothetical protein BD408DRAFT_446109 [Parasitella parasitica]|nr:hypothetical protein BD408DRAFT_446109 [Parasitella parasitica]
MSPQLVSLENLCPECDIIFSTPTALLNHLRSYHSIVAMARTPGRHRPNNPDYLYVKDKDTEIRHSACPCCWAHFPIANIGELKAHIRNDHLETGARAPSEECSEYAGSEGCDSLSSDDLDGVITKAGANDIDTLFNQRKNSILIDLEELVAKLRDFVLKK